MGDLIFEVLKHEKFIEDPHRAEYKELNKVADWHKDLKVKLPNKNQDVQINLDETLESLGVT